MIVSQYCSVLTVSCLAAMVARNETFVEMGHAINQTPSQTLFARNTIHALALSRISSLILNKLWHPTQFLSKWSVIIPFAITFTVNGLTEIASNKNYLADEMKKFEEKMGVRMDILSRIASVILMILLAPEASKSPIIFGLSALTVGCNIAHSQGFYLTDYI